MTRKKHWIEPDLAEVHINPGSTLQELGRLDEAEANYTQAITLTRFSRLANG